MTEFELDMLELDDLLPMRNFYPDKPGAYIKMYRLGMTERRIKRRLWQLIKDRNWSSHNQRWWRGKYDEEELYGHQAEDQPHRMHSRYPYESDYKYEWDYYRYRFYNRAKEKWRSRREQNECPCDLCTGNLPWKEDLWNDEEYYELDSGNWFWWQMGRPTEDEFYKAYYKGE